MTDARGPVNAGLAVGVLGLGTMGRPMAGHLLAGHGALTITGRTRRPDEPLVRQGAHWVDTPRELAATSRVVLTMLPDLPQLREVLDGPDGLIAGVSSETLLLIGSTSSPTGVRELAAELTDRTDGL